MVALSHGTPWPTSRMLFFENNASYGLDIGWGSVVHGNNAQAVGNGSTGYQVGYNSTAYLNNAEAINNGSGSYYGFQAFADSIIYAQNTTATGNGIGYALGYQSYIQAVDSTYSDNGNDFNITTGISDAYNRLVIE